MSDRSQFTAAGLQLDNTIGAFFVGNSLQAVLTGLVIQQSIAYFNQFPQDKKAYKALVAICTLGCCVHCAFTMSSMYYWTVTGWGDVAAINVSPIQYPASFPILSFIVLFVQGFFAHRIYIISERQWFFPSLIVLISLVQLGAGLYLLYVLRLNSRESSFTQLCEMHPLQSEWGSIFPPSYVWMYSEAAADFIITGSLITYLQRMKESTVFDRTRSVVNRLCVLSFETNALTSAIAIIVGVILQVRGDGWGPGFNFCLPKLYTISLLVSLNARKAANIQGTLATGLHSGFASQFNKSNAFEMSRSRGMQSQPGVEVSNTVEVNFEDKSMDEKTNTFGSVV